MWNKNNNYTNSFIWLILLILIFFKDTSSSSPISEYNYFRLTDTTNNTNNLLTNGLLF